jgi:hypothetical protein
VGGEPQRLAAGVGEAGLVQGDVEQFADRPVLRAQPPLEQQRHRRVPDLLVVVVGHDEGTAPLLPRIRVMMADRTSASSG